MSILNILQDALTPLVTTVVTGTLVWVGHRVASWFKHKTGIDLDKQITAVLDQGIKYAEEAARKYANLHKKAWESDAKKNAAVLFVTAKLKALHLPSFAKDLLEQMIEARLNDLREQAQRTSDRANRGI